MVGKSIQFKYGSDEPIVIENNAAFNPPNTGNLEIQTEIIY